MAEKEDLLKSLESKIYDGYGMIERLRYMIKIDGIDKLIRKVQQEIKFLEKVMCNRYHVLYIFVY